MINIMFLDNSYSGTLKFYIFLVLRFPDANGAFLYPMYGHGELSQAFCRRAAVKGCLQVSSTGCLCCCNFYFYLFLIIIGRLYMSPFVYVIIFASLYFVDL